MTSADYCKQCNAPHAPAINVLARCGACAVINGKLPPTKFVAKLKEKNTTHPAPVQCWKCGDMDAEFQACCKVPACGMKESA